MTSMSVDRTRELEEKLKALCVASEDTCVFWERRDNTRFKIKTCFHCQHYRARVADENVGICIYKRYEDALELPQFKRIGEETKNQ